MEAWRRSSSGFGIISRQELVTEIGKAHVEGLKPDVEVQEVESTIKSLAGCMYAKAAIEALENIYGPQCRVMATRQLAEIPLGFYSAIIMGRLFGLDVAVRAGCSAGSVVHLRGPPPL